MEIKLYNQDLIVDLMIKYIKNHNDLPLIQGKQIDRKGMMDIIKDKLKWEAKNQGYCKGQILKVRLIRADKSIDGLDVIVPFLISSVNKSGIITVKLFEKKF